jgi:glycosyltransferase involved in cell wall biosynthesis
MDQIRKVKRMKILIIVFNTFQKDNRVERQAKELTSLGYDVSILALHAPEFPYLEERDNFKIFRFPTRIAREAETISKITSLPSTKEDQILLLPESPLKISRNDKNLSNTDRQLELNESLKFLAKYKRKILTLWSLKGRPLTIIIILFTPIRKLLGWMKRKLIKSRLQSHKSSNSNKKVKKNLIINPISYLLAQLDYLSRKKNYYDLAALSLAAAKNLKPDFVLANDFNGMLAAEMIFDHANIPFAYDAHELWTERNRPLDLTSKSERMWERKVESRAMKKSSFNFTVCQSIADYLASLYQIKTPTVIRNTPNLHSVHKSQEFNLKNVLGLPQDSFLAIYVGKITYNRGIEDIINALEFTNEDVYFVTMGHFDSSYQIVFNQIVKEKKLQHRVFCHPSVSGEHIPDYVSSADISLTTGRQICLSYYFGLPNKLFESLQAHIPLIAPNSPEFERVINEFECGLIYTDQNYVELAGKINLLHQDVHLRKKLAEGSKRASQALNWENERKIFIEPFEKLLEQFELTKKAN